MKVYVIVDLYTRSFLDFIAYPTRQDAVNSNLELIITGKYDVIELTTKS